MAFHFFHILIKIYLACKVKIGLKKKLPINFKPTCYLFLLYTFFSNFIFTYHKPNGGIDVFKMKDEKLSNLFFCVFENYHILKWDFKHTYFLI
jgi:hypothetical protein